MADASSDVQYTIKVSAKQAAVLSRATELLARLGMGQIDDALRLMPISNLGDLWETSRAISKILAARHGLKEHGIASHETSDDAKIAWDLYQTLRHRLSWDRAVADGVVEPLGPRKIPEMIFVNFDEPLQVGPKPLAEIKKAESAVEERAESRIP